MILSDNETKIDMLNNRAIAKTVAELIIECDDRPISIGVHGDWDAGKSSTLAMVEGELSEQKDGIECIRFNGWKHQGFEDANPFTSGKGIHQFYQPESLMTLNDLHLLCLSPFQFDGYFFCKNSS